MADDTANNDKMPLYHFSDNRVADQILDAVMSIADAAVSARAVTAPRVAEAANNVPSSRVEQILNGNINGAKWRDMGDNLENVRARCYLDPKFLATGCG